MEERGASLAQIADVPTGSLVLLAGPPGAGKSTFCRRVVLNALAMERPVIFVTTERGPAEVARLLREDGMGEPLPDALTFVDAFGGTVGLATSDLPGTVGANCQDLNSISMALARLQQRTGRKGVLLAFDSLTSPYLFNREEVLRFARLSLGRFAAEGNSVVALMDEGCGKEEDLGAMMSIADGILRMEIEESSRVMSVVKHPTVRPTRIEVPMQPARPGVKASLRPDPRALRQFAQSFFSGGEAKALRREVGDFVNLFWPNLAHWSGILWDPKGFPTMIYQLNKEDAAMLRELREDREVLEVLPWPMRLAYKATFGLQGLGLFFPKDFSSVEDMGKLAGGGVPSYFKYVQAENSGALEYLDSVSRTDEHIFRMVESCDCSGFENVGAAMASHIPPAIAGECKGLEIEERDWNAIETKCIGLGDPYCEFKLVPGPIDGLTSSL
jgi:KaiC/GvpD/RAD55 family RecA-like ATPase